MLESPNGLARVEVTAEVADRVLAGLRLDALAAAGIKLGGETAFLALQTAKLYTGYWLIEEVGSDYEFRGIDWLLEHSRVFIYLDQSRILLDGLFTVLKYKSLLL